MTTPSKEDEAIAKEIVDTAEDCPHYHGEDVVHDQSKREHNELWLSEKCLTERIASALHAARENGRLIPSKEDEEVARSLVDNLSIYSEQEFSYKLHDGMKERFIEGITSAIQTARREATMRENELLEMLSNFSKCPDYQQPYHDGFECLNCKAKSMIVKYKPIRQSGEREGV